MPATWAQVLRSQPPPVQAGGQGLEIPPGASLQRRGGGSEGSGCLLCRLDGRDGDDLAGVIRAAAAG
jgi:hypothetical protein